MEAAIRSSVASRIVTCLWCHEASPHAEVVRHRGLCRSCAVENGEIGWRLIYDRDLNFGAIPANLRAAYQL